MNVHSHRSEVFYQEFRKFNTALGLPGAPLRFTPPASPDGFFRRAACSVGGVENKRCPTRQFKAVSVALITRPLRTIA